MNQAIRLWICGLFFILSCLSIGRATEGNPSGVELSEDSNQNLVLNGPDGKHVVVTGFSQLLKKYITTDSKILSTASYLVDLSHDGKPEVVSLVCFENQENKLLIMNRAGDLLALRDSGAGEELLIGLQKPGLPVFIGYKTSWGLSAGVANWEFCYWDGSTLRKVLETIQWIGKGGPGIKPHFKYLPHENTLEIVSDNGKMLWNKDKMRFIPPWKPLD